MDKQAYTYNILIKWDTSYDSKGYCPDMLQHRLIAKELIWMKKGLHKKAHKI